MVSGKLQQLELDGNSISSLGPEVFKDWATRTRTFRLSIRHNALTFIDRRAFADMGNLRLESLNLQVGSLIGRLFIY